MSQTDVKHKIQQEQGHYLFSKCNKAVNLFALRDNFGGLTFRKRLLRITPPLCAILEIIAEHS